MLWRLRLGRLFGVEGGRALVGPRSFVKFPKRNHTLRSLC